jgi:DNA-binding IclR family transcriptional regulator
MPPQLFTPRVSARGRSGIRVIARAAAVLRCLSNKPSGLSADEIAARVNLPSRIVQRIVSALAEELLLAADARCSRVTLGPRLVHLAAAANFEIVNAALRYMRDVSELTDETVDLSFVKGGSAVYVEQVRGSQLSLLSAVGQTCPLHCTASGKALLSLLPREQRDYFLSRHLPCYTRSTVIHRDALNSEIQRVNRSQLAYEQEEHHYGVCGIAAAFRDPFGRDYALSISVPASRFAEKQRELSMVLLQAVRSLSRRWRG